MSKTTTSTEKETEKDLRRTNSVLDTLQARGYHILAKIGEGAYAVVYVTQYQAKPTSPKILLACKILDTRKIPKQFAKKFLPRELEILGKVKHPNIINVHSIFAQHTKYFIFMNLAQRGDLLNFIVKNGAVREPQAYLWFQQMTLAVQYLHGQKIAHRDLKCENVLIDAKYNVKLSDFGFARYFIDVGGQTLKSKTFCGSVSYAPPEILSGIPYNPLYADMWSLGVILFVMLNKSMPFDDTNVKKIYESQMEHNWRFRPKVAKYLSDEVHTVVMHLLEPEPRARWTTVEVQESTWFVKNVKRSVPEVVVDEEEAKTWEKPLEGKVDSGSDSTKKLDRKEKNANLGGL